MAITENHMVRCSRKDNDQITHIGGTNSDGTAWQMTEQAAVAGIKSGRLKFYVNVNTSTGDSKGIWIGVAQERGREILKPQGDGADPSLLHNLPACP